ncbi:hypothetical protein [Paradevosia shaoguanensis]|uniref:Uncharacterized protein n=1 Tax=Paradevosia shaoguanensis TaxID=1335043 RepID=A0AA41QQ00_9HYPH|nr:hypothetical protein [Paradevosia shaoguanensis]MBI4048845.1 hypothetical protein [Devosia nanyangense]QMV01005.1 hypothetical protein GHV40_05715 [Devosia sp. D6-9]CDP50342.1 hypothetical protein [Devosia sp. DBB001]MCF1743695.1 hypothetical protein [Paradevosia shaoguanensis]MCI0128178.1 hypothetical protein [Paradevosia shaoguanensis]
MHSDKAKYCTYVLWLSGCSRQTIAGWTGLAESQVRGIVSRSPWHNRTSIPREERQRLLQDYRAVRFNGDGTAIDGGLLDRHDWVPRDEGYYLQPQSSYRQQRSVNA